MYAARIKVGLFAIRPFNIPRSYSGIKSNGAKQ
nr:MAG TPA: hypothetical protein [Caudoviricetes sp.]